MLWVYGQYKQITLSANINVVPFQSGMDFIRQNLTCNVGPRAE